LTGRVQGVGCRPFICTQARRLKLTGLVYNDTIGVVIEVQGAEQKITEFLDRLQAHNEKPALLEIVSLGAGEIPLVENEKTFVIQTSDAAGAPLSQVTPDMATCNDCLNEIADADDFRYRYPFINCTNCGPRYSIVKTIPYDRPNTTMNFFDMCPKCRSQYEDVADRRFHAQPVACPECGPGIWLADATGARIETDSDTVIEKTAQLLRAGKIVAIKGVGGFHLAVDALNNSAVVRLRRRKHRDHKPFAMMAASLEKIAKYAIIDDTARKLPASAQCPVVLLGQKPNSGIAPAAARGVDTFGFMLCYAPLHHLLFGLEGIEVLVMTSGNISDEPLICDNDEAIERLGCVADAFLMHDRQIYRRIDDSVVQIIDNKPAFLRRARGYVPGPIYLDHDCTEDIFAAGADLKNTFCFARHNQLILSEHIGDLEDGLVYRHYAGSIKHLQQLFEVEPKVVVCDLHPGYLSTQYAESLKPGRLIRVQHHWAHIASVLAENKFAGRVIGLAADGTGFGTDGAIWGCECLIASLTEFERFGHLAYYPLPGADKAGKEAIRPILGLLSGVGSDYLRKYQRLLETIDPDAEKVHLIAEQLEKGVNTLQTSSLGRLFDAVAAILGLGTYNHFEAQLPMALEAIAAPDITDGYDMTIMPGANETLLLDFRTMIGQIIEDVKKRQQPGVISARFHNGVAKGLLDLAIRAQDKYNLQTVALSGGVFCNRYLANRLIGLLKNQGFCVLFNRSVPANDGGIALGQAAIASSLVARRS
jgi:hydrogenase maturation protein HypF